MKKNIVLLLTILLVAAVMIFPVFATTGGAAASEVTGEGNKTVDVIVSVHGYTDVESLAVVYDVPDGLTLKTAAWLADGIMSDIDYEKKQAVWASKDAVNMNTSTDVFKLTFLVKEPEIGQTDLVEEIAVTVKVGSASAGLVEHTAMGKVNVICPATAVTLNKNALSLDLCGTATETLSATIAPANTTERVVTWTSADSSIATVDANGKVTAVAYGTTKITATVGNVSAICNVAVGCSHSGELQEFVANPATCEGTGNNLYYLCKTCKNYLAADKTTVTTVEEQTLKALGHKTTHHDAVKATCVKGGNVEYWSCSQCGKNYGDGACTQVLSTVATAVDPSNHTGTEVRNATTASCYQDGYTGDTYCKGCNVKTATGSAVKATGKHVAGTAWVTNDTHHWHTCTTSGCTAQVEKAEHSFQWRVDEEATEYVTGLKHEECACGYKRSENTVIPKLDHVHKGIEHHAAVPATCVKTGTVEYWTCSSDLCEGKYYGDEKCQLELTSIVEKINAGNHTGATQLKDAVDATCSEAGYSGDTYCSSCKALIKKGAEIPATGKHTPGKEYVNNEQEHWQTCTHCKAVVGKEKHKLTWIVDQAPTEETVGKKHQQCTVCKYTCSEGTEIEKLKHEPALVNGQENTCTEDGLVEHFYCKNCDRYYASEDGAIGAQIQKDDTVLKASGHSFGQEWVSDENNHWHACHCGEKSDEAAHDIVVEGAVESTKENAGYTGDSVCSVCGDLIAEGKEIPSKQEAVLDEVQNAENGSTIQIGVPNDDGTKDPVIPAEVLEAAKGKDVDLVLDMGDYQWVISGEDIIGAELAAVDMGVKLDTQNIPEDVVASVAGKAPTKQLSLTHNGAFGFKAGLKLYVGKEYAGQTGSLYYYNEEQKLELVSTNQIDADGNVVLTFDHASDYVVVISANAENPTNPILWIVLAIVGVAAVAVAVVVIVKKKRA